MSDRSIVVPVIAGLTASGKSALALRLARENNGLIINADAMQVYRGFDIGTAKPSVAEQADIPHALIDICEAQESYSVAQFVKDAVGAVRRAAERGCLPIICGGSGQYTTALLQGTRFWPLDIDASIEHEVDSMIREKGYAYMLEHIEKLDPATAAKLSERDTKRIRRFFLVFNATGMTRTEMNAWANEGEPAFDYKPLCLAPSQHALRPSIETRTAGMYANGLVEETRLLLERHQDRTLIPFVGIGYRHTVSHLLDALPYDRMVELTIRDTMRLAKRQRTWYRHHDHGMLLHDADQIEQAYTELLRHLEP